MPAPVSRIVFIDLARSFAVFLALFNHALTMFGGWVAAGRAGTGAIRFVSCVATPSFIILAGAMFEMVYLRIWERQGGAAATRRLLRRAAQCWAGYLVTVLASLAAGTLSPRAALKAAVFLGETRFGNILKFYVFVLAVAVPLLAIRRRWGIGVVVGLGLAPWLAVPWLDGLAWPAPSSGWSYLTATLVGRPVRRSAISLWHALALIVVGMAVGWAVQRDRSRDRTLPTFRRTVGGIALACAAIAFALVVVEGPRAVVSRFVFDTYRFAHHVGYYALGTGQAMVLLLLLARWWPIDVPASPAWRPLLIFGQWSLTAFALGSALLDMLAVRQLGLVPAFAAAIAFTIVVAGSLLLVDRWWPRGGAA